MRLLVVQVAFGISYSTFLLLPKFLRVELHASATVVGFVGGTAVVTAALAGLLFGRASRHLGIRNLLAIALVLESLAAFGFMTVNDVGVVMLALRVMQGLAWAITFAATAALCVGAVPTRRMAEAIAYLGVAMLGTNALAPALTEPFAATLGWPWAFAFAGIAPALALTLLPRLPTQPTCAAPVDAAPQRWSRRLLACYWAALLTGVGIGVMFTFVQPYVLAQGAERVGALFVGHVLAAVTTRLTLGRLIDRLGPPRVTVVSQLFYAITVTAAAVVTPSTLLPLGLALGVSHGLLYPALTATALRVVTPAHQSTFLGRFGCAFNSGFAVATLTLGSVADRAGYPTLFLSCGVLLATGPLAMLAARRDKQVALA